MHNSYIIKVSINHFAFRIKTDRILIILQDDMNFRLDKSTRT